jgi:hypothetical protein
MQEEPPKTCSRDGILKPRDLELIEGFLNLRLNVVVRVDALVLIKTVQMLANEVRLAVKHEADADEAASLVSRLHR